MQIQACPSKLISGSEKIGTRADFGQAGGRLVVLVSWQHNSMAISGCIFGWKTHHHGFDS